MFRRARDAAKKLERTADWRREKRRADNWRLSAAWDTGRGVLLGCGVALFVLLLLANLPIGGKLQYDTLDFWFRLRDPLLPRAVAILAVDEATVYRWGGRNFNASDVARLLRELKNSESQCRSFSHAGIGFDHIARSRSKNIGARIKTKRHRAFALAFP